MSDEQTEALRRCVYRIKAIGAEIAALQDESKRLRLDTATLARDCALGNACVGESVRFIMDTFVVDVVKSSDGRDYSVTFKELSRI